MVIVETLAIFPREIDRSPDAVRGRGLRHGPSPSGTTAKSKKDYLERAMRGGFPEAQRRSFSAAPVLRVLPHHAWSTGQTHRANAPQKTSLHRHRSANPTVPHGP